MMTDNSTSGKECGGLSALGRERNIFSIFNFHTADSENILWDCYWDSDVFKFCHFSEIDDVTVKLWKRHANRVYLSLIDEPGYILSLCDTKKTIASMINNGVLPINCGYEDIDCFFAERAALARWCGIGYLASEDNVPVGTSFWWDKYIDLPRSCNPVRDCGFLIAGNLLRKNFSEIDFLRFALQRRHIWVAVHDIWKCPGNAVEWELTPKGMEAAERLGLLNPEPDATEEPAPTFTGDEQTTNAGRPQENIWRKNMVKVCLDCNIDGVTQILEVLKTYLDETMITDDKNNIVSKITYGQVRNDLESISSGKFDAFIKKNKTACGNVAEISAFKKWLRKEITH